MKSVFLLAFVFAVLSMQVARGDASLANENGHSAADSLQEGNTEVETMMGRTKRYHPKIKINCNGACSKRCSEASRKNVCHRACNTCCQRCHCVPPGTSGHAKACPCYASLRTHGNRPKCP
ncbi:hypothetical protein MLD38_040919 [Melastoma candidum]|nr:hypothetical protein MLD38_040919 [Melastoma candidum]